MNETKERRKIWDRKYRENNKEKVVKSMHKYSQSEYGRKHKHDYYIKNKERDRERKRKYDIEWAKRNPEKAKAKYRRYYHSLKGIRNMLAKHDRRRLGLKTEITYEDIKMVNERDKVCVYCGKDFEGKVEYDHINPFKPFSKCNIVKTCKSCNKSKSSADVMQWLAHKKYEVSPKIQELYKKVYNL